MCKAINGANRELSRCAVDGSNRPQPGSINMKLRDLPQASADSSGTMPGSRGGSAFGSPVPNRLG